MQTITAEKAVMMSRPEARRSMVIAMTDPPQISMNARTAKMMLFSTLRPESGEQHHLRSSGVHADLGRVGHRNDHAPSCLGPGHHHGFFGSDRLHLQHRAGAEPGGAGDDLCGAHRFSNLGMYRRHADRALGVVYAVHRHHAGVLEKITALRNPAYLAQVTMISTSMRGSASFASTVARAGRFAGSAHAVQAAFISSR